MIQFQAIRDAVAAAVKEAGVTLPDDVGRALAAALEHESQSSPGRKVIARILENLEDAQTYHLPMCQDTGMVLALVDIGTESEVRLSEIDPAIEGGIALGWKQGFFRSSIVSDPVFDRNNTGTNLPAVIRHRLVPGSGLTISLMLKGFGSENCTSLAMPNPTSGSDGVKRAVVGAMEAAGGKPCPPTVIGVGIGGTADQALLLSKRALFRDLKDTHPDPRYARLEAEILSAVNDLAIGPGGLGGSTTALAVKIEAEPTHIAGMPVGISISCWADRKAVVKLESTREPGK